MYASPLLGLPGAAPLQDPEGENAHPVPTALAGVAWHYGNPLSEQRFFESGCGMVDLSHRRLIKVEGADAATFLNNLLSQKLDDAPDGFFGQALDLDGQGHVLHQMQVSRIGDAFYLDTTADRIDSLREYLHKMVFWSQVVISDPELAIIALIGPERDAVINPAGVVFSRQASVGLARRELIVSREMLSDVASALVAEGVAPVGLMAYTAARVRALEPEASLDLDDKSIPHEAAFFIPAAVHLHKGCYRGQETVARVDNLGRSPRVMVLVHIDGSAPDQPRSGDAIESGGRVVGRLGTVVDDYEYGPIGLALIKRSALGSSQLVAGQAALAIDRDSLPSDEGERPGRAAINKLRGI